MHTLQIYYKDNIHVNVESVSHYVGRMREREREREVWESKAK
jgi:hypothetical protein